MRFPKNAFLKAPVLSKVFLTEENGEGIKLIILVAECTYYKKKYVNEIFFL